MKEQLDLTASYGLEVDIREDGKVVWVSVDGITVLRVSQIPELEIIDRRIYENTTKC